ncbi:MAG: C40 family peptidase [Clostridiales bacterium]|nr:C40 family peptidase [Candidatus Crickella caballi]
MTKIQLKKDRRRIEVKILKKKSKTKVASYIIRNNRRIKLRAMMTAVFLCVVFIGGYFINKSFPSAVTVEGEDICYLNNEETDKLIKRIGADYIPKGADLKAIKSDGAVTINKALKFVSKDKLVTQEEAGALLDAALEERGDSDDIRITAISTITKLEEYTPESNLEKDDTLLAGESVVEKKGKKGQQKVTRTYITVNKEVQSEEKTKVDIVDPGKPATIKKGTLGLPEGEDWKTYEGNPVYENGEEVATTAMNYLGAPYKYGGKSLETGIDCVWFVVQMYKKYGINLPANHKGLKNVGAGVPLSKAQKGDIVCYSNHVSIYLGDGKVVEANSHQGVRVGKLKTGRVVTIRRVVK